MTQKTKLEILGPYTPEHDGPFCTRDGKPVRVLCSDMKNEWSIVAIVLDGNGEETVSCFLAGGKFSTTGLDRDRDLMNAREVPAAREFWVNEYAGGSFGRLHDSALEAVKTGINSTFIRTIHVREVLSGDE